MFNHFTIAGNEVHLYSIFLCLGICSGALLLEKNFETLVFQKSDRERIRLLSALIIPIGLFGARSIDLLLIQGMEVSFHNFLLPDSGGYTFLGGFLVSFVFVSIFSVVKNISFRVLINLLTPSLVLGHFFGRIGCFFAGCCFGKPTNSILGIIYPKDSLPYQVHGIQALHPTQLYESIILLFIFLALNKIAFNKKAEFYLLTYGIARFFLEIFRDDERGQVLKISMLSPSQLLSIILIGLSVVLFKTNTRSSNSKNTLLWDFKK